MNNQAVDERQRAQEIEYLTPYHWFWKPDTESGRSYFAYLKMVANRVPSEAKSLIDIGCGDGRGTAFLKDSHPECTVSGVDYSDRALDLARTMAVPRQISWKLFNAYNVSEESQTKYDCATAVEMLEHLPPEKLELALRNVRRVLVTGGTFILTVPSVLASRPVKHYQHFTQETITSALQNSGFHVVRCDGQERAGHWLFTFYRFADNRWWTIKPVMRWFNCTVYPNSTSPCAPDRSNRLIVVARAV